MISPVRSRYHEGSPMIFWQGCLTLLLCTANWIRLLMEQRKRRLQSVQNTAADGVRTYELDAATFLRHIFPVPHNLHYIGFRYVSQSCTFNITAVVWTCIYCDALACLQEVDLSGKYLSTSTSTEWLLSRQLVQTDFAFRIGQLCGTWFSSSSLATITQ